MDDFEWFGIYLEEVIADVEITEAPEVEPEHNWIAAISWQNFKQTGNYFLWTSKEKWFLGTESTPGKDAVKIVERI